MQSTFCYLHALSALHVGTGQGAGVIDLPLAREKATHLPYVPGSSLKGVLREELRPANGSGTVVTSEDWEALFGPERVQDDTGFAGAITLGDAQLLCLPVRSLAGTFAWATCPFILARYAREAKVIDVSVPSVPSLPGEETALIVDGTELAHENKVVLEDLDFAFQAGADAWAGHIAAALFHADEEWQNMFKARFSILPDGVLDFLAETATEGRARVRIDNERRVVAKGALWYEENLPAETVLYGLVAADRSRKNGHALDAATMLGKVPVGPLRLQLGGKATVGRGLVNWIRRGT